MQKHHSDLHDCDQVEAGEETDVSKYYSDDDDADEDDADDDDGRRWAPPVVMTM